MSVKPSEFFPALGTAHLQNGEQRFQPNRWEEQFEKYRRKARLGDEEEMEAALKAQAEARHIPQMAGEILVEQYDGDVEAIMEDHPEIVEVNGRELWEGYCVPILKDGSIP